MARCGISLWFFICISLPFGDVEHLLFFCSQLFPSLFAGVSLIQSLCSLTMLVHLLSSEILLISDLVLLNICILRIFSYSMDLLFCFLNCLLKNKISAF